MGRKLIHRNLVGAYVYAIKVDGIIRYIGKGRRYRVLEHFRYAREINRRRAAGQKVQAIYFHNKLAKAFRENGSLTYEIIASGLTDDAAYERERVEILAFPKGQLWNLREGGMGSNGDVIRAFWRDPEFRKKTMDGARRSKADPDYRERARQTANEQWADVEFRERWTKQHRGVWDDPVLAQERRDLLKRVWSDPEKTAKKSALVKSQWTPERRAAQKARTKAEWADPEFKAKAVARMVAAKRTPEYRAAVSARMKQMWAERSEELKIATATGIHRARSRSGSSISSE